MAYHFICKYKKIFGLIWLLRRLNISKNAYYNFLKNRKNDYLKLKDSFLKRIESLYHKLKGVYGYRYIKKFLEDENIFLSYTTVHKYLNIELGLKAIVRRPKYRSSTSNSDGNCFPDLLKRHFRADNINNKWCTDFTYLTLANGEKHYNCTIIDLFDRSVVASITDKNITSELAIRTLQRALKSKKIDKGSLILHSDQGSQFTSYDFSLFCKRNGIVQSMSRKGNPWDNAPMERYFNTLKQELIYLKNYKSKQELYMDIEEFSYVWYNRKRPHTFNGFITPYQARFNFFGS